LFYIAVDSHLHDMLQEVGYKLIHIKTGIL